MNSRWQAGKIGLINFWYYDEQEFPFVKGRMLLRGSNGSGKSVTMQSVVPLLLDGNMSPERLDPFGSRDRKMSSYLLEENDGREERTGYLYLEFKRKDSDIYFTIGMGIRARRGKPLDKWYFSLTDGRRVGKDFFLYKDMGEKVTLSRRELEYRVADGGKVFDRQVEYMDYVNRQIFGFETLDEYKEMLDLLIQLRTPKLSKDFKPSVINDILSDSLQPLSDEDLRPMSEAIENMDTMNMNLKSRREARQAAEKIHVIYHKYNKLLLWDKAEHLLQSEQRLQKTLEEQKQYEEQYRSCCSRIEELDQEIRQINEKKETLEKERESLNKSDAVALKMRETLLTGEIEQNDRNLKDKKRFLTAKEEQCRDAERQIRDEEDRKYRKETELKEIFNEMQDEAEQMAFQEFAFMREELVEHLEESYKFELHRQQFEHTKQKIAEGEELLSRLQLLNRQKEEMIQKRERQIRELDAIQRRLSEWEGALLQAGNEWKEEVFRWNKSNTELKLDHDLLRELASFAENYEETSDFAVIRNKVSAPWIQGNQLISNLLHENRTMYETLGEELKEAERELIDWENRREPQPVRSEAVLRNRQRLEEEGIPYQEFYKLLEFGSKLSEEECNHLEEALLQMGILDAIVVEEQYRDQVLRPVKGCEDHYLFTGKTTSGQSLLDVLELNEEVNDIFSNQRLTGILSNIAYDGEGIISVAADGTYRMGVLAGTVAGEHQAGFLGTKARERNRKAKMAECRSRIAALEEQLQQLAEEKDQLLKRKEILQKEYDTFPEDDKMRTALRQLQAEERKQELLQAENDQLGEELTAFMEQIKELKRAAVEIAEKLYLTCSHEVFADAKRAAQEYDKALISCKSTHEMLLRSVEYLRDLKVGQENLLQDMDQIRYDIRDIERLLRTQAEERASIQEQLKLTDYEAIKDRLDACILWLNSYPERLEKCLDERSMLNAGAQQNQDKQKENAGKLEELEKRVSYYTACFEEERKLQYAALPQELPEDARHISEYLSVDVRNLNKEDVIRDLNRIYFENRGFLTDYQPTQTELFAGLDEQGSVDGYSAKRTDIQARYQGTRISFDSLLAHLDEDIQELETLIKDGDRELFEDILANTVSRKIRGKINASNTWVQKMNALMDRMDTSSSLKLNLRWRSKTAEKEDQMDTRELVELLKKDYRLMSEEEASRLSAHFRSKVEEARRNARDSGGMISFYQIMKETLDYRKWFEFQLFSQKNGERQKELTNSVFGTFSGGEKAMSMYVPLFSAVVAKYQGGREDAPRLISLDEAFAGVDNRNIRDMFRLMTQFEFDFIINSQVLWGDCDTLDALAIYQLIRPENAKFVTVMPYLWNGSSRELLEDEESVEECASELV